MEHSHTIILFGHMRKKTDFASDIYMYVTQLPPRCLRCAFLLACFKDNATSLTFCNHGYSLSQFINSYLIIVTVITF